MYEAELVPAIFAEWAPRLVTAAGVQHGDRILDVACGTGVVARAAAARVGPKQLLAGQRAEALEAGSGRWRSRERGRQVGRQAQVLDVVEQLPRAILLRGLEAGQPRALHHALLEQSRDPLLVRARPGTPGRRGVKISRDRCSSYVPVLLSIQPKQRASSITAS